MMKQTTSTLVRSGMIRIFLATTIPLLAMQSAAAAESIDVVSGGVARDAQVTGAAWNSDHGALVGTGTGNVITAGKLLGPGDFTVAAKLSVASLAKSAATFMIDSSHS